MANIVSGLFGLSPQDVQAQQQAQIAQGAAQYATASPFDAARQAMYQAGAGAVGIGAGALGIQNPAIAEAQEQQDITQGVDLTTADGYIQLAAKFQAQGMPQQAAMAIQQANAMNAQASKIALDTANTQKALNADNSPASVQEYKFAQEQGFKGTYQDWIKSKAQSIHINTGTDNQLSPDAVDFMANQVVSGDTSVLTGLARTKGALAAVRNRIAQLAKEGQITPRQMAMASAEFKGAMAGERTLGQLSANISSASNEAHKMIPLVKLYSERVDRTQYPNLNAISNAVQKGTGDSNIVQLNASINALINSYSRAINPKGVPTVADKEEARKIINAAYSNGQINSILDVMSQEMEASLAAPSEAQSIMRKNFGASGEATPVPTAQPSNSNIPAPPAGFSPL